MAGIYLHIPYCKQACHYCDFHFSTNTKNRSELLEAMLQEMELRSNFIPDEPIETIYFGGGTPSLLSREEIEKLIGKVRELWQVSEDAEITLEANPDDLLLPVLENLKAAGINRLSIGVQSFHQKHLEWMNRAHNEQQAFECLDNAEKIGFRNINIDLIYGFPMLTDDEWKRNIEEVVTRKLPHVSCYSLTVEPGTALERFIRKGRDLPPDDEQSVRHFEMLTDALRTAGYDHYEVSNFALPGNYSRHNTAYWTETRYLGIGPSAHSFNGRERSWNVRNNPVYIRSLRDGNFAPERETIDLQTAYNEYVLTRLRTARGVDIVEISERFDVDFNSTFKASIAQLLREEKIITVGRRLRLTRKGFLWADAIAARFFILSE